MFQKILLATGAVVSLNLASAAHAAQSPAAPVIPPAVAPQVRSDLGSEAAACAAYYTLGAMLGERDFPNTDMTKSKEAAEWADYMALTLVDKDVALANVKLAYQDMQQKMGTGGPGRFSIVVAEYSQKCKTLLEDPASRIAYWTKIESDALLASAPPAPAAPRPEIPDLSGASAPAVAPAPVAPAPLPTMRPPLPTKVAPPATVPVPYTYADAATRAFMDGRADRLAFETWASGLTRQTKEGALYWASVRSTPKAAIGCVGPGYTGTPEQQEWANGCQMAKARLDPTDIRRNHEPNYKAGWNSASREIAGPQPWNS